MNTPKKSAGRPPKSLLRKIEERKGILPQPLNPKAVFELTHDNPDMFKSLFDASKKINDTIKFIISPVDFKLIFESKNGGCYAITEIYGSRVIGFFCSVNKTYSCLSDKIIKILKTKKKQHNKITFTILESDLYSLNITFTGAGIDERWRETLDLHPDIDLEFYNNVKYQEFPLTFTLEWSYFKEIMNSWKNFTNGGVIFSKDDGPLRISFAEGLNTSDVVFNDEKNINMIFNSESLIAVSVPIINLLNCSSSDTISQYINFHISEDNMFVLTAKIDESFKEKKITIPNSESAIIKFYLRLMN